MCSRLGGSERETWKLLSSNYLSEWALQRFNMSESVWIFWGGLLTYNLIQHILPQYKHGIWRGIHYNTASALFPAMIVIWKCQSVRCFQISSLFPILPPLIPASTRTHHSLHHNTKYLKYLVTTWYQSDTKYRQFVLIYKNWTYSIHTLTTAQ